MTTFLFFFVLAPLVAWVSGIDDNEPYYSKKELAEKETDFWAKF
jgi:hypothetical protein